MVLVQSQGRTSRFGRFLLVLALAYLLLERFTLLCSARIRLGWYSQPFKSQPKRNTKELTALVHPKWESLGR